MARGKKNQEVAKVTANVTKEEKNIMVASEVVVAKEVVSPEFNSIIEVVVNGMSVIDVIEDIKERLQAVERSVFNIALECAYVLGKTIPAYTDRFGNEHGEATIDAKEKVATQAKLVELVGRTDKTISRWIIAMDYVLENGYFHLFANGFLPFSYDKIILICRNTEVFQGKVFSDLMAYSVSQLKKAVEKHEKKTTEAQAEKTSGVTLDGEASEAAVDVEIKAPVASDESAIVTYQGKDYTVPKALFEAWLAENGKMNITE